MKSVLKNYFLSASNQILNIIIPIISAPYISRILKPDGVGTYSFINAIVMYFVLFAGLGTLTYGCREVSYRQNDREGRTKAFWEIELISITASSCAFLIYLLVVAFAFEQNALFLICGIQILGSALDVSWLFSGMEEFKTIVLRNATVKLLCLAGIFLLVKQKQDLWIYILLSSSVPAIGNIALWPALRRHIGAPKWKQLQPLSRLSGMLQLFVPTIAIQIYINIDKLMIGLLTTTSFENGYYEQATKVIKSVQFIVTALGGVVMPRVGRYFEEGDDAAIIKQIYSSFNLVWFMAVPLCFGMIGVAHTFVPVFYGAGYERVEPLIYILVWIIIIIGLDNLIATQYLIPTKQQKVFTKIVFASMICNLLLDAILIPHFLAVGAAAATILSELVVLFSELWVIRKKFSISRIISMSWKYVISGCVMLAVVLVEEVTLPISAGALVVMILSGAGIYFVMLLVLRDKLMFSAVSTVAYYVKDRLLKGKG